jgi:hypothetical protein
VAQPSASRSDPPRSAGRFTQEGLERNATTSATSTNYAAVTLRYAEPLSSGLRETVLLLDRDEPLSAALRFVAVASRPPHQLQRWSAGHGLPGGYAKDFSQEGGILADLRNTATLLPAERRRQATALRLPTFVSSMDFTGKFGRSGPAGGPR